MLMQQVREVMTVNQELKDRDESSWIWLMSEQIVFPLRSEFAEGNDGEAGSSKQCNDQHTDQTAFFLKPIREIMSFIRKKSKGRSIILSYHHRFSVETRKGNAMIRKRTE